MFLMYLLPPNRFAPQAVAASYPAADSWSSRLQLSPVSFHLVDPSQGPQIEKWTHLSLTSCFQEIYQSVPRQQK